MFKTNPGQMKRKLKIVLLSGLTFCCASQLHLASAQEAEIAQLILNIEKLVQFKQILSDMKKGYDIISKGYGTVKNITEGNFSLHEAFLNGLLKVNPEIAKYRKVADIVRIQATILSEYRSAFTRFRSGGRFTPDEIIYISKVYDNLFNQSLKHLDELVMVLTTSSLRMNDGERLEAIDRLYIDIQQKLGFLRNFNRRTGTLDAQRGRQLEENRQLEIILSK
jgi:hypothetical protein